MNKANSSSNDHSTADVSKKTGRRQYLRFGAMIGERYQQKWSSAKSAEEARQRQVPEFAGKALRSWG